MPLYIGYFTLGTTTVYLGTTTTTIAGLTALATNRTPTSGYLADLYLSSGVAKFNVESGDASNCTFRLANTTRDWILSSNGSTGKFSILDNTGGTTRAVIDTSGNLIVGNASAATGATNNIVLGSGATNPVLGGATSHLVSLAAVDDVVGGDRRFHIQSELGSAISLGNDHLDFAAATAKISIAGTDVLTIKNTSLAVGNTGSALGRLESRATSGAQIVSSYDATDYMTITTGSVGSTTFALTGTSPTFTFSQNATFSGMIGVGIAASSTVAIKASITPTTSAYGANVTCNFSPASDTSSTAYGGIFTNYATTNFNYTQSLGGVVGVQGTAALNGVTSATVTRAIGVLGFIQTISGSTGTITNGNAFYAASPSIVAGTCATAVGLYIAQQDSTNVTTGYGIYQAYSGDINYFAGNVGIGTAPVSTTTGVAIAFAPSSTGYGTNSICNFTPTADTAGTGYGGIFTSYAKANFNYTSGAALIGVQGTGANFGVTSGTINRAAGVAGVVQSLSGSTGTITNGDALYALSPAITSGTVTNAHGLFIAQQSTTNVTTGYGIYQSYSGDMNYFAGNLGIGTSPIAQQLIRCIGTTTGGASHGGLIVSVTGDSSATTEIVGSFFQVSTSAASYTCALARGIRINDSSLGSGSTITLQVGVDVLDQTHGTTNYGIRSAVTSGSNKWNIYSSGTATNYFAGPIGAGVSTTSTLGNIESRATSGAQIVTSYDASNYMSITTASSGSTTLALAGTTPTFTFSQAAQIVRIGLGAAPNSSYRLYSLDSSSNVLMVETSGATSQAGVKCAITGVRSFTFSTRADLDSNGAFSVADETVGAIRMSCDKNGWFGFGGVGLARVHAIENAATASERGVISEQFLNGTTGGMFIGRKARISGSSRITINSGDRLAEFFSQGYDGTNFIDSGKIVFVSTGTIGTGRVPCDMVLYTSTDVTTSVVTEVMRLTAAGNVGINTSPSSRLHVIDTTETCRFGYDASNYWKSVVSSAGALTLTMVGTTPALTVNAGSVSGTNTAAGNITLQAGQSTGNAVPARFHTQAGAMAGTGTTVQTLVDRLVVGATKVLTNNSAIAIINCTEASGSMIGGKISYSVEVTNGTDYQVYTGTYQWAGVNKAGVFTNTITLVGTEVQVKSTGTLTVTFAISGANPAVISVNANSSLTPSTGYPRITYKAENTGQQAIAIQ